MTVAELKGAVESYREGLRKKTGIVMFGETGPVGMLLIDAIVQVLETQQAQIDKLAQEANRVE